MPCYGGALNSGVYIQWNSSIRTPLNEGHHHGQDTLVSPKCLICVYTQQRLK